MAEPVPVVCAEARTALGETKADEPSAKLAHANGIGKDKAYITRMRGLVAKKRKCG